MDISNGPYVHMAKTMRTYEPFKLDCLFWPYSHMDIWPIKTVDNQKSYPIKGCRDPVLDDKVMWPD